MRMQPAVAIFTALSISACLRFDVRTEDNTRPVADAGDDQSVSGGDTVTLVADGSDADLDDLTYEWTQVLGTTVILSDPLSNQATFVSPELTDSLVFQLRAHDGIEFGSPDNVTIEVVFNAPPTANAGDVVSLQNTESVAITAGGEDPEGLPLTGFQWTAIAGPVGADLSAVLRDSDQRTTVFSSTVKGEYTLELVVNDGEKDSAPDLLTVVALNNPPTGRATVTPSDVVSLRYELSAADTLDPDGDAIASYEWRVASTPTGATASFVGGLDTGVDVLLDVDTTGFYDLELIATDDAGDASAPYEFTFTSNRPPVLALSTTTIFVEEDTDAVGLDASATTDLEGDTFVVTWTRVGGNPAFPDTLNGLAPTPRAPAYRSALLAGDTSVDYEVVAFDATGSSPPQTVTIYVQPSASTTVLVSSAAGSYSGPITAGNECGTMATPCRQIGQAIALVNFSGSPDGRLIAVGAGGYTDTTNTNYASFFWPSGSDFIGGLDEATWAPTGTRSSWTILNIDSDCAPNSPNSTGLLASAAVNANEVIANFDIVNAPDCITGTPHLGFFCEGCSARVQNVSFLLEVASTGAAAADDAFALRVAGPGSSLSVESSEFFAVNGEFRNVGGLITDGANVDIYRSRFDSAAADVNLPGSLQNAALIVAADGGTAPNVTLDASTLRLDGPSSFGPSQNGVLIVSDGNVTMTNSVVINSSSHDISAVSQRNTSGLVLRNNTIIGSAGGGALGAGVYLESQASLLNNLIQGHGLALNFDDPAALSSILVGNRMNSGASGLANCFFTSATIADLNGPSGGTCNESGTDWSANTEGTCALEAGLAGDAHLTSAGAEGCIDQGVASGAAGDAPATDIDGEARPQGAAPDIGADEAG